MSEVFNKVEVMKYHARQIRNFCKDHRCATCTFHIPEGGCIFLINSPCDWKGIEDAKGGAE